MSASYLNGLWVFIVQYRNTNILIKMNKIEKKGKWDDNRACTLYRKGQGIPFLYEMQHFHTYLILAELRLTLKCHSHCLSPFFTNRSPFRSLCLCVCMCVFWVLFCWVWGFSYIKIWQRQHNVPDVLWEKIRRAKHKMYSV